MSVPSISVTLVQSLGRCGIILILDTVKETKRKIVIFCTTWGWNGINLAGISDNSCNNSKGICVRKYNLAHILKWELECKYRMFPFIICLILMNYLMEFYFISFVDAHLPGCFCPWTFRLNIGLNTSPSDSFVSYLNSHLGYSAGEFQALQLIVLAVFGAVD